MVKKLKNLLQSSWIRRCSVLMSCALILLCSVVPAFAVGLSDDSSVHQWSWISGTVVPRVRFGSNNSSDPLYSASFDFGGSTPFLPETGVVYIGEQSSNFHNNDRNDSLDYTLKTGIDLSRRKQFVYFPDASYNFDRLRYRFVNYGYFSDLVEDVSEEPIQSYFQDWDVFVNPFLVQYDDDFINNLFKLRLDQQCLVTASATFSFIFTFDDGSKQLINSHNSFSEIRGHSNIDVVPVLTLFSEVFSYNDTLYNYPSGVDMLISDLHISIRPYSSSDDQSVINDSYLQNNDLELEILSCQYFDSLPIFYSDSPVGDFMASAEEYLNAPPPPVLPDSSEYSFFTRWLASVVSGFFEVEIMPGFSLGGVITALLSVVIGIVLLKFFSGG